MLEALLLLNLGFNINKLLTLSWINLICNVYFPAKYCDPHSIQTELIGTLTPEGENVEYENITQ